MDIELVFDKKTGKWKKHEPYRTVDVETKEDWDHLEAAVNFYCNHKDIVDAVNAGNASEKMKESNDSSEPAPAHPAGLYTIVAVHQDDTKEAIGLFLSHDQAWKAMCDIAGTRFKALKDADEDEDPGCLHLVIEEDGASIRWIEEDVNDDIASYTVVDVRLDLKSK